MKNTFINKTLLLLYLLLFIASSPLFLHDALGAEIAFVINAHGAKTEKTFNIRTIGGKVDLYTPEDLISAYLYQDDGRDPKGIENIFQSGKLPGYAGNSGQSNWQHYPRIGKNDVPDVDFSPLNFDQNLSQGETGTTRELQYFKENMTTRPSHWAYDTGEDALLLVKNAGGIVQIKGHTNIKTYMGKYNFPLAQYDENNAPVLLFVPKQNKVKVLGRTSLSEVIAKLQEAFGGGAAHKIRLLMATCNASSGGGNKSITLSTDMSRTRLITTLFP